MTPGPASPTLYEQCHGFIYVPFRLMCENEEDKARSRVLPPPPPPRKIPSLFQATLRRRQNGEEGLFGGGGILKHPEEGINSPKRTRIGISKVACSRRSAVVETGQGEQNWRGHWRKSEPLPNFLFFFFRSLYFSSVLHYLNAWDRLLVKLTLSRH